MPCGVTKYLAKTVTCIAVSCLEAIFLHPSPWLFLVPAVDACQQLQSLAVGAPQRLIQPSQQLLSLAVGIALAELPS